MSDYRAVLYHESCRTAQVGRASGANREALLAEILEGRTPVRSALRSRLEAGQRPLVVPPPRALAYPWYAAIEQDEALQVCLGGGTSVFEATRRSPPSFDREVMIFGSPWRLLELVDEHEALVTCRGWEASGFRWRLFVESVPAAVARYKIPCTHDPALEHVTTLAQLQAETRWRVDAMVEETRRILHSDPESLERRRHPASRRARRRPDRGLLALPSRSAQDEMARNMLAGMLRPAADGHRGSHWYAVDASGALHQRTWRLRRVAPERLPDTIYMDLSRLPRAPAGFLARASEARPMAAPLAEATSPSSATALPQRCDDPWSIQA